MRFVGLLMVAGVIGFSHSAEGREQNLDGDQGVFWVEGGIDTDVPENAIRVLVGGDIHCVSVPWPTSWERTWVFGGT